MPTIIKEKADRTELNSAQLFGEIDQAHILNNWRKTFGFKSRLLQSNE